MRPLLILLALYAGAAYATECASDADCCQSRAIEAMKNADWGSAVTWWERAYAARSDAVFVFNLASTYDQWGGHCRETLSAFDRYFAVCPPEAGCLQRNVAGARMKHVSAKCHGTLRVGTDPAGADVSVNDEPRGSSPVEVRLLEGTYRVVARLGDRPPVEQAARVSGGQTSDVTLAFPKPKPPPPRVDPEREPEAVVVVQPPPPPPPEARPWRWVALGIGGAGLITGVVFTSTSLQAVDDEEAERAKTRPDRDRVLELRDDATRDAVIANVGYGIGVVGLTAGVVMLWLDASASETTSWTPVVGPGVAGVQTRF